MTDAARLAAHLTDWIRRATEAGGAGAVFGLSGGIDSAVVGALAKRAFPEHTLGVLMPCHSDPHDAADAARRRARRRSLRDRRSHARLRRAGAEPRHGEPGLSPEPSGAGQPQAASAHDHAVRVRQLLGYFVVGSSNRSELTIGYFTKYGDGGVDLLPLGGLVKHEVRELAHALGMPQRIIDKPPSAGPLGRADRRARHGPDVRGVRRLPARRPGAGEVRARIEAHARASAHKRALPKVAPLPDAG